jgi:hypothetical protein
MEPTPDNWHLFYHLLPQADATCFL